MITSKQRAQLRGMAAALNTELQIGKGGITENVVRQTEEALAARELIKGRVLETSPVKSREAAELIADAVGAVTFFVSGFASVGSSAFCSAGVVAGFSACGLRALIFSPAADASAFFLTGVAGVADTASALCGTGFAAGAGSITTIASISSSTSSTAGISDAG